MITELGQTPVDYKNSPYSGVQLKQYVRKINILEFLNRNGGMTVPEISRKTHTSSPTTGKLIEELMLDGLVNNSGQISASTGGGPRPQLYTINPESRYILGIDVGRHNTRMGILNFGNQIITDIESYEIHLEDPEGTVNEIVDHANAMIESATIDRQKLLGIGIALPGLVNSESGRSYSYFDFEDTTIRTVFEQKFSKPVVVENDARAMTLGEWRYGLAQDRSNVLNLNIGWGVGVGMILNGKLYPGGSGFAGELGHIRIAQNGLLCHCGKRGCLETVASGTALARLAKEGIKTGNLSILNKMVNDDLDAIEAGIVIQAANDGDEYAIEILGEIGSHLGEGIAVLIHLFNPEMIILGGRISKADKYIIDPIKQALNKFTIEQIRENTKIVVSELQEHAGVMGAAALILESLFDNSNIMSIPIY